MGVAGIVVVGAILLLGSLFNGPEPQPVLPTPLPSATQAPTDTPTTVASPTFTETPTAVITETPSPTPTVPTATPTPIIIVDFVELAPKARWYGNNNRDETSEFYSQVPLDFGLKYPDPVGFAVWDNPLLENNRTVEKVLFTRPFYQSEVPGLVTGFYDLRGLPLQKDFRFVARVGFAKEAEGTEGAYFNVFFNPDDSTFCSTTYTTPCELLGQTYVQYDGKLQDFVFTIPSDVVGQEGWLALQKSSFDYPVWVTAHLERP